MSEPRLSASAEHSLEANRQQWKYRRRLAFTALWASITLVFVVLFCALWSDSAAARLDKFQMFLATALSGLLALCGAYMGFATWQDVRVPQRFGGPDRFSRRSRSEPVEEPDAETDDSADESSTTTDNCGQDALKVTVSQATPRRGTSEE